MEGDLPPMLWNDIKRSKEKGIMTMLLVRHLLSDAGSAQRLIISLMRHYDLLCEYSVIEKKNLKQASDYQDFLSLEGEDKGQLHSEGDVLESQAFFIPCLLEHAVGLESDMMNDELKSLPLMISSAPIRISQPLFYRVLTLLCKRFRCLAVIYRNVGYFHIYPGHRLEFALNKYNYQMTVMSETHTPPDAKVCAAIRKWIVDVVDKAKQQGMAGLKLQLGFNNNAFSLSLDSLTVEFVSLDGYQHTRSVLYSSVTSRQIQPPPKLSVWFPQLQVSVSRQVPSQLLVRNPLSYSMPVKNLIDNPIASCLLEVSQLLDEDDDLGDDWRRLWSELLDRPVKEDVVRKKSASPTLYLLKRWCMMKPSSQATIGQLMKALNAIYRNDVACVLEAYCQSSETSSEVSSAPTVTVGNADKVTAGEFKHLAEVIEGCWEEFASTLAPDLFKVRGKITAIKHQHPLSPLLQAKTMLEIWRSKLGVDAHRESLIEALIELGLRAEAYEVFGKEVVEQVAPQQ